MLVFKINNIKINKRREFIGKAEIQLISIFAPEITSMPVLKSGKLSKKGVGDLCDQMFSHVSLTPIEKVKRKQEISLGPEGLILFQSPKVPKILHWQMLITELDGDSRKLGRKMGQILDKGKPSLVETAIKIAGNVNPGILISNLMAGTFRIIAAGLSADKDDQVGLYISSFTGLPAKGKPEKSWNNLADTTGNVAIDLSIINL